MFSYLDKPSEKVFKSFVDVLEMLIKMLINIQALVLKNYVFLLG